MESFETLMERKSALETELKRRAMIFQYDTKAEYAELLNLPLERLENLPYPRWVALQADVVAFKDEALRNHIGSGATTCGVIWSNYAKRNPHKLAAIKSKHQF